MAEKTKLMVKGILFDLDGTIVDSKEAYLDALRIALARTGQKDFDAKLVTEVPRRLEQNIPIDDIIKGIDVQTFLKAYLAAYYQATATKTKPIHNVSNTLRRLSKKTRLALVTMRYVPKKNVIRELQKFGLARYFQYVTTALDTHDPKPSPEALLKCTRQLGLRTCECAVVGDSVADVKAGKNAGTKTVAVLSGIFFREELEKERPDLVLKNVTELPEFLG